jgi:beta propeller repeat protein
MKKILFILLSLSVIFYSCEETDTTPPTVTITSPQNNSTVSEIVTITCMSSDDVGVKKVELWIGGVSTGIEDDSEPYSIEWNTTQMQDGNYTVIIRSYDTNENTTDSDPITLVLDNSQAYPTSVEMYPIEYGDNSFTVSWTTSRDDDFMSYTLLESLNEDNSSTVEVFNSNTITDTVFVVSGITSAEVRYYQIIIEDAVGLKSESLLEIGSSYRKIVFRSQRNDMDNQIYIMDEMGNGQTNLSNSLYADFFPLWSPDGDHILFTRRFESYRDIFIMDIDGNNQTNLSMNNDYDSEPHISSDGTKIVYRSDRGGYPDIYTMNIDGSNQIQLTETDRYVSTPQFSPDMAKITYISRDDGGKNQVFIMDANGSNKINLTDSLGGGGPQFSPDGSKITFLSDRDGNLDIYLMNVDGTEVTNISSNTANNSLGQFSPDGSQILFISDLDGDNEIMLVNVNDKAQTQVTNNEFAEYHPKFSHEGEKIVFMSSRNGNYDIYIMNIDGTDESRLTTVGSYNSEPQFQP